MALHRSRFECDQQLLDVVDGLAFRPTVAIRRGSVSAADGTCLWTEPDPV
jgi:hypothetical protein